MKGIFEFLAGLVKVLLVVLKGDQPKRQEIENATNDLEKEDKNLQKELESKIKNVDRKWWFDLWGFGRWRR